MRIEFKPTHVIFSQFGYFLYLSAVEEEKEQEMEKDKGNFTFLYVFMWHRKILWQLSQIKW